MGRNEIKEAEQHLLAVNKSLRVEFDEGQTWKGFGRLELE